MSSLSSFSGASSLSRFSVSATNQAAMTDTKVYVCPNCRSSYDFSLRNNLYIGRVPLLLKCGHTMCEECIRNVYARKIVTCFECKEQSILDLNEARTIQEVFPVNFYLMGVIYYSKPNMSEVSKLTLRPAGVSYRHKDRSISLESSSSMSSEPSDVWSQSVIETSKEKCCQVNCKKTAVFRCSDCDDFYCQMCCQTLHRAAKGLQKHKITPVTGDSSLELTEKCALHSENVLEFYCNTCSGIICAYCVIQSHQGHSFYQLTFLNESDKQNFKQLIENAQEKLKKLILAYKKIKQMYEQAKGSQTSSAELTLSNYFAQLHGRIQMLERKLRVEARNSGKSSSKLIELGNETLGNVKNLHKMLSIASGITGVQPNNTKYNVKVVIERLESALELPCYIVGDTRNVENLRFVHDKILDNLEECFSLSSDDAGTGGFRLVSESNLPEGYESDDAGLEVGPSDISSLTLTPDDVSEASFSFYSAADRPHSKSVSDILIEGLQPKGVEARKNTVESWIQSVSEDAKHTEMPKLKQGNREYVMVSHIDSPECFFVQLCRFNDKLQQLNKDIAQYVLNFAPIVKNVEINQLYIVKYENHKGDRNWYRGRAIDEVKNQHGETAYKVIFIDYGNTGIVQPDMMRLITTELLKPKPLAWQCKLFNLYSSGRTWDKNALMLMIQILTGVDTLMVVLNDRGGFLEVDLIIVNRGNVCSIREALIFIGHGIPALGAAAPVDYLKMKTTQPLARLHNRTENFKAKQAVEVILSHVVDPDKMYVQMADYIHHIDNLNTIMSQHYNKPARGHHRNVKGENIYVPKKDMIIAVRCPSIGDLWYRGVVKSVQEGRGLVEVFVVDYGKTIVVSYTEIRKLSERFRNLDCQALLMRMSDIKPKHGHKAWSDPATEYLEKYVEKKEKLKAVVTQADKPPKVLLFECYGSMDLCINAMMVKKNLAISTGKPSTVVEWPKESPENSNTEPSFVHDLISTIQSSKIEEDDDDDSDSETVIKLRRRVQVLLTKSPNELYVALEDDETKSQQQQLYYALQDHYKTVRERIPNPEIGDRCVVFCQTKGEYFRAVITAKLDDLNFSAMLRDIAEELTVSKNNVYVLEDEFKVYMEGAIRCHLTGIVPAGDPKKWSGLAIEYLQELFTKHANILMAKDGPVNKIRKSFPVVMWYMEIKGGKALEPSRHVCYNINKLLIKNGLALKDKNAPAGSDTEEKDSGTSSDTMKELTVIRSKTERIRGKNTTRSTKVLNTSTSSDSSTNLAQLAVMSPTCATENAHDESVRSDLSDIASSESDCLGSTKQAASDQPACVPPAQPLNTSTPICSPTTLNISESEAEVQEVNVSSSSEQEPAAQTSREPNSWLPPKPFTCHNFSAIATFIDDNGHVFLHESKLDAVLKAMEEKMKAVFDEIPPEPPGSLWVPGQLCTAKYFVNGSWYRGRVTEVKESTIKVLMIDYGNEEECNHEDLRYKVMYLDIPTFANKVKLDKVFPRMNTWLTSDLDELHRKIVEQTVQVSVKGSIVGNDVPPAIIMLEDTSINSYMLKFSSNLTKKMRALSNSEEDDVIVEDISDPAEPHASPVIIKQYALSHATYYHKPLSEDLIGQKIPVTIVSLVHFNKFIFELNLDDELLETKKDFEQLSEDIQKNAQKQPLVGELHVGLACVAKFSEDGLWYRGEIAGESADSANVWFVDFGNFEVVDKGFIRAVKPEWLMFPVQQYIGHVDNIQLPDESNLEKVFENLIQYCSSAKIAYVSAVDPLRVELHNEDGALAYQDLIDEGLLVTL